MLEDLRSERDDLHEVLRTQFASNGSEDAGALRIVGRINDDDGVAVETQIAAIGAADRSLRANDDGLDDLALLHGGFSGALLDVDSDDIADSRGVSNLTLAVDHGGPA